MHNHKEDQSWAGEGGSQGLFLGERVQPGAAGRGIHQSEDTEKGGKEEEKEGPAQRTTEKHLSSGKNIS